MTSAPPSAARRLGLVGAAIGAPVGALFLAAVLVIATGAARGDRLASYAATAGCTALAALASATFTARVAGLARTAKTHAGALAAALRRPRELVAAAALGVAVLATSFAVAGVVERAFGADHGVLEKLRVAVVEADALGLVLAALGLVLLPAVCEELLFRGAVFDALADALGARAAVVGSALLFGAYHLDPRQGLVAFVSGLVLGEARRQRGGVGLGVLAHALNNAAALVLSRTVVQVDESPSPAVLLGAALVAAAAWAVARRRARACAEAAAAEAPGSAQGASPESWTSSP